MIDVAPTVLEALGLPSPPTFQGRSLMPLVGKDVEVNPYVYAGAQYNMGSRGNPHPFFDDASINDSIRSRQWKLIHEQVFQKSRGVSRRGGNCMTWPRTPGELRNVATTRNDVVLDLAGRLQTWREQAHAAMRDQKPTHMEFPPDFVEKARQRGYW